MREIKRQLFHVALGMLLLAMLLSLSRSKTIYLLSAILFFGFLLINLVMRGYRVPLASWFVEVFERKDAPLPGYGSVWYIVGLLICCLLIEDVPSLCGAIAVLAFGDAASTIFGMRGKTPLPYNNKKTVEGTIAFILFSLTSFIFIGWNALPLSLIAAFAESLPIRVDDNLTIPIVCSVFFRLL